VSASTVVQCLYAVGGPSVWSRTYPETGQAIALAANHDPLAPEHEAGAEATAALLLAWACRASRFQPNAVRGRGLGLFLIEPPTILNVPANRLTLPRTACLVAVDLLRKALESTAGGPWHERIEPAMRGGDGERTPRSVDQAALIAFEAGTLLERFFPRAVAGGSPLPKMLGPA
jgi:hypothetical protein